MTTHFEHSLPTPTPLCAIYEPLLPLYVWDELDAEQMDAVRAHLEADAYCQYQVARYQTAVDALRTHVATDDSARHLDRKLNHHTTDGGAPIRLTLENIMQASEKPPAPLAPAERLTPIRQLTPRQRKLTALGAIAAVLVLAVLAASLFTYLGSRTTEPVVKPTPTANAQLKAYALALKPYYVPMAANIHRDLGFSNSLSYTPSAQIPQLMAAQRPIDVQIVDESSALLDHWPATAPAELRTEDVLFKQAVEATHAIYAQAVTTIDKQDVQGIYQVEHQAAGNWVQYCGTIDQIDVIVPADAYLPVAVPDICANGTDDSTPTP